MKLLEKYTNRMEEDSNVDMTPLIDMVFILLIFFIVTTVFVKETGVELNKPESDVSESVDSKALMIAVTPDGSIVAGGQHYTLESVRALVNFHMQKKEVPVLLMIDKKTPGGIIVDVMSECKKGGAKQVNIATEQK